MPTCSPAHAELARRPPPGCLQKLSTAWKKNTPHVRVENDGRFLDLIEIDAASNTSVDDIRDLRDKINFTPNQGRYKVYIIDEVHMLSTAAFNALLKTLEEPPAHAIFVLATTEVHKIPATVLSRCQRHEFRRIPVNEIVKNLKLIARGEGIQADDEALTQIARQSTGAMRDAISLLDQLASTGHKIDLKIVQDVLGTATSQTVLELVDAIVAHDAGRGLDLIHTALDAGSDPRQLARQIVDYLRDLLMMRMGNAGHVEATAEIRAHMDRHAQVFNPDELMSILRAFNSAAVEGRGSWLPSLPLEMALVGSLAAPSPEYNSVKAVAAEPPSGSGSRGTPALKPQPVKPAPAAPVRQETRKVSENPRESSPDDQQSAQNLAANWDKILFQLRRQNSNLYSLITSCKCHYMHGSQLMLGFASEVLKEKMEKEENLETAQQVLSQNFQKPITIMCFVDAQQRNAIPDGVDENGMVAAALRDLGGEIVDLS
jgi:DNA polymerase-3 subunit gamma/tau